jgi:WD40 repeat protein
MVDDFNIGISASYDYTMIIWDLDGKSEALKLYGPHHEAILDFDWRNSLVVSGDKAGTVAMWVFLDPSLGSLTRSLRISMLGRLSKLFSAIGDQLPRSTCTPTQ